MELIPTGAPDETKNVITLTQLSRERSKAAKRHPQNVIRLLVL
jgi:hypothetical protein